jgi:hypothetical protein
MRSLKHNIDKLNRKRFFLWLDFETRFSRKIEYEKPPVKVIITGLPRSGTSFLTNMVSSMGFYLGPEEWLKPADQYNRYGYFENRHLLYTTNKILNKLEIDYHNNIPIIQPNWIKEIESERKAILQIVNKGNIEIIKENKLCLLANLYDELFPDAKWIFIQRDIKQTYKSRFGEAISFENWEIITNRRIQLWKTSKPSKKALNLDYQDFIENLEASIEKVEFFLGIDLTETQKLNCLDIFKPKSNRETK